MKETILKILDVISDQLDNIDVLLLDSGNEQYNEDIQIELNEIDNHIANIKEILNNEQT